MSSETSQRQKQVDKYLRAALIGTIAIAAMPPLFAAMSALPEDLSGVLPLLGILLLLLAALSSIVALLYSFIFMFRRRATDEYTLAMWHNGTTVAFFAVIAWLLIGDLVQVIIITTIIAQDPNMADPELNVVADWAGWVVGAAFFVGFHFKRLRG